jgi:hypothetical protein
LEIRRRGRVVEFQNRQTREEHEAFLERMRNFGAGLPAELSAEVAELRKLIAHLPVAQTLSELMVARYTANPETFIEPDIPSYIGAEYLTWLFLTNDPPPEPFGPPVEPEELGRVYELLDKLVEGVRWRMSTSRLVAPSPRGPVMDELVMRARTQHLLVRGHAYAHHNHQLVLDLFEPPAGDLRAAIGFDAQQAVTLAQAATNLVNSRLQGLQVELHETVDRWEKAVKRPESIADITPEEIEVVRRAKEYPNPAEQLRNAMVVRFFFLSQTAFAIRPSELAEEGQVDEAVARAFLEYFSLALGHPPVADSLPSVYEDQVVAPAVRLGDDTYLVHLVPHLTWAMKGAFETTLASLGRHTWARYERHRSRYLETRSRELLTGLSPFATGWQNLTYSYDDGSGIQEFELDGLVQIDGVMLLVECKAGVMSASARRGGVDRLADDLENLVSYAFEQVSRADRYIKSAESVTFRNEVDEVIVQRGSVKRSFLISTTLDPLSAFVTHASALRDLGLVRADVRVWSVYLPDLQVIAELVSGSGEFLHYLSRREDIEGLAVDAHDELDWFGHYLLEGLYFDEVRRGAVQQVSLNTYTTGFDDFYSYQAGERSTPVDKPQQAMPPTLRRLMERLEAEGPPGFTEAIWMFLDGDTKAREYIANGVERQRRRGEEVGQAGFRIFIGDRALAYLSAPTSDQATIEAYADSALDVRPIQGAVGILDPRDGSALAVTIRSATSPKPRAAGAASDVILPMRSRFEVPPTKRPPRAGQARRRDRRPKS